MYIVTINKSISGTLCIYVDNTREIGFLNFFVANIAITKGGILEEPITLSSIVR